MEDDAAGNTAGAPVLVALLEVNVRSTSTDACDSVTAIVISLVAVVDESGLDAGVTDVVGLAAELEVAVGLVVIDELMTVILAEMWS